MSRKLLLSILAMSLLNGCSHSESYYTEGHNYSFAKGNVAILSKTLSKDKHIFDLHSPQAYRVIYYPFLYSRDNGVLKFVRYCQPMEIEGYRDMMVDERNKAGESLQSIASIEKSCKVKGVKLISFADAGRPMGGRGGPDNRIGMTANVLSPKTKQWEEQHIDLPEPPKSSWW